MRNRGIMAAMEEAKPTSIFSILAQRRWGRDVSVPAEELSKAMSDVSRSRMPWAYNGGRPRTVQHTEAGRCTCVECRKARGHYPGSVLPEDANEVSAIPPEIRAGSAPK